jgi:hypothetical protein
LFTVKINEKFLFSLKETFSPGFIDDRGWSEWQSFSECKGIPCGIGRQRRIRTCLNPPTITNRPSCDGDQIQERECQVACPKDSQSPLGIIVPPGLISLRRKKTS